MISPLISSGPSGERHRFGGRCGLDGEVRLDRGLARTVLHQRGRVPDLLLFSAETLRSGTAGVRAIGWFGNDWSVERGDIVWNNGRGQ